MENNKKQQRWWIWSKYNIHTSEYHKTRMSRTVWEQLVTGQSKLDQVHAAGFEIVAEGWFWSHAAEVHISVSPARMEMILLPSVAWGIKWDNLCDINMEKVTQL
jgi:hypothetical protein